MEVRHIEPAAAAIAQVTSEVAHGIRAAWAEARAAHVVLSGGRSGSALAGGLRREFPAGFPQPLHIWIADERFVEFDHADRNDTAIIEALGEAWPLLIVHRHATPSQAGLEASATSYANDLITSLAERPFDAVVLSAGEDGHVASVFPGHVQPRAVVYAESASPKPPALRTTISLARLAHTLRCFVLVLGESKREALRRMEQADGELPAVQLAAITPLQVITDLH